MSTAGKGNRNHALEARQLVRLYYDRPDHCSTGAIARRLGLSPSALCHRYRIAFGSTIGTDVRHLRIRRALELLREDPGRLFKEVAAEVGYTRAAYRTFLNAFRLETGMSPTTYVAALRSGRLYLLRPRPVGGATPVQSRICSA